MDGEEYEIRELTAAKLVLYLTETDDDSYRYEETITVGRQAAPHLELPSSSCLSGTVIAG